MSKETYSVKVDNKTKLKSIPADTVRDVLNMLCEAYSEGVYNSGLFVFEVEKDYTLRTIEAHKEAIRKLEQHLCEVEENIKEHKEIAVKEQKELDKVWNMLYIAHFEKESLKTGFDVYTLISNGSLMNTKDLIDYCLCKIPDVVRGIPKNTEEYKQKKKGSDWLTARLKELLIRDDLI